nr:GNAT family N-acetyltransferase [Deinococcus betulae]
MAGSYRFVLAVQNGQVIGFVQAISDGVLTAFIPLLEVHPDHQGQGIGRALMERMLAELGDLYATDLACDDDLVPFYEGLGLRQANLMFRRNYAQQNGRPSEGQSLYQCSSRASPRFQPRRLRKWPSRGLRAARSSGSGRPPSHAASGTSQPRACHHATSSGGFR